MRGQFQQYLHVLATFQLPNPVPNEIKLIAFDLTFAAYLKPQFSESQGISFVLGQVSLCSVFVSNP